MPPTTQLFHARHFHALAATILLLVTGCQGNAENTHPVHGTVALDGRSLAEGRILFESIAPGTSGRHHTARGRIDAQGRYTLTTFSGGDGAIEGRHRVVVLPTQNVGDSVRPNSQPPIPGRYTSLETSPLHFDVVAGDNEIDIVLTTEK